MKAPIGILLIFVVSACFLLSGVSDVFALFRDDISTEEAAELVSSEREKSKIELERRKAEAKEEKSRFKETLTPKKKQIPPSVGLAKKVSSNRNKKIIIGAVLLVIVVVIAGKLSGSKGRNRS